MMPEPTIADRLAETARLLRSPLARDGDGELTDLGEFAGRSMRGIIDDLATVPAVSAADALALSLVARDLLSVFIERQSETALANEALGAMAVTILRLQGCLEMLSDRPASELDIALHRNSTAH